ncbi:hypothetical protein GCM10009579_04710 [Streptomyces javensis]|uniref:Uncharacterized protein n=1 Tax=Streptomyces javensis TaxID=114698 RepID=A0ABP4H8I4_9ACTN
MPTRTGSVPPPSSCLLGARELGRPRSHPTLFDIHARHWVPYVLAPECVAKGPRPATEGLWRVPAKSPYGSVSIRTLSRLAWPGLADETTCACLMATNHRRDQGMPPSATQWKGQ